MDFEKLRKNCVGYLTTLCREITDRSIGSEGNRQATRFFEQAVASFGWHTEAPSFAVIDWQEGAASLQAGGESFQVRASPYAPGCKVQEQLVAASTLNQLERVDAHGKVLLLRGEIAQEPLMPKNFAFYNPPEHQRINALLEAKRPAAIVTASGRNPSLAGGVYPFPMIEDGDFDIPSVYMTTEEGQRLTPYIGQAVRLASRSERIPARACNVIARKGRDPAERVVITAHIDAKKGTPGAIDNATGVVALLLLAELLASYNGDRTFEIAALNGEDHYAAPGQMDYIGRNQGKFGEILLNVNIDGAGYHEGKTAASFYNLPEDLAQKAAAVLAQYDGLIQGDPWPQGDHSIFLQYGRPAVALTSDWLIRHAESQEITHTPKDNLSIVDCGRIVEVALALKQLIENEPER